MRCGVVYPQIELNGDPGAVKAFAQAAEDLGYDHLVMYDHVLGAEHAGREPALWGPYTEADPFHEPLIAFAYLTGITTRIEFTSGVIVLPQRQTALVAKQAACLDVLCRGRFRLGIGVGWNEVEYVALNENFTNRGRRSEEQVQVMQALWREEHVTFKGRYHTIDDAGINPRPASGRVPVWYGGHHENTLARIARWGDGWMPNAYPPDRSAADIFTRLRAMVEAQGRDPASIGIEVWTSCGAGSEADWRKEAAFWRDLGVTHLCLTTTYHRRHHHRIAGTSLRDHLAAATRYRDAIADLL